MYVTDKNIFSVSCKNMKKIEGKNGKMMIVKLVNFLLKGQKKMFEYSKFSRMKIINWSTNFIAKKTT